MLRRHNHVLRRHTTVTRPVAVARARCVMAHTAHACWLSRAPAGRLGPGGACHSEPIQSRQPIPLALRSRCSFFGPRARLVPMPLAVVSKTSHNEGGRTRTRGSVTVGRKSKIIKKNQNKPLFCQKKSHRYLSLCQFFTVPPCGVCAPALASGSAHCGGAAVPRWFIL